LVNIANDSSDEQLIRCTARQGFSAVGGTSAHEAATSTTVDKSTATDALRKSSNRFTARLPRPLGKNEPRGPVETARPHLSPLIDRDSIDERSVIIHST
jgi:hypothetical protein